MGGGKSVLTFHAGRPLQQGRVGVLPGAFNPPTIAHVALAREARREHDLDQVVFLLPRVFPHKGYRAASFEQRLALLDTAAAADPAFAVASSDVGLFIDIARAFRKSYGLHVEIFILCGRDAAERAVSWDYQEGPGFERQLDEFQLLVASRGGRYDPPEEYKCRVHPIQMPDSPGAVSSSMVREAIARGEPWKHWVAAGTRELIVELGLYRKPAG